MAGMLLQYFALHQQFPARLEELLPLADAGQPLRLACPVSGKRYDPICPGRAWYRTPGKPRASFIRTGKLLFTTQPPLTMGIAGVSSWVTSWSGCSPIVAGACGSARRFFKLVQARGPLSGINAVGSWLLKSSELARCCLPDVALTTGPPLFCRDSCTYGYQSTNGRIVPGFPGGAKRSEEQAEKPTARVCQPSPQWMGAMISSTREGRRLGQHGSDPSCLVLVLVSACGRGNRLFWIVRHALATQAATARSGRRERPFSVPVVAATAARTLRAI